MKIRWDLFRYFVIGMGSISVFPELPDHVEADINLAIPGDFKAVGDDIRKAMKAIPLDPDIK